MRLSRRRFAHAAYDAQTLESLEARTLMFSAFNPDGPVISNPSGAPTSIITADFDGDAKPDLVMSVGNDILFQKGGGGGRFGTVRVLAHLNTSAGLLGVGDFNNDGLNDLFSIQADTFGGWHRMLMNNGSANFSITSYGRLFVGAESVTVGNIDSDGQDEVLVKGKSPIVFLGGIVAGEVPKEVYVLDPTPLIPFPFNRETGQTTPRVQNLLPFMRFNNLGPAVTGQKLAAPVIANLFGGSINNILVGGEDGQNPGRGFVRAYAFVNPVSGAGVEGGMPIFNDAGGPVYVNGVVSSLAVSETTGDSIPDVVVSTLTYPVVAGFDPIGFGAFQARTVVLPRTGAIGDFTFGSEHLVDQRSLAGPAAGERRTLAPEYRIAWAADINSDGLPDVGLSIVQEFSGPAGSRRVARFVQATHSDVVGIYGTRIVAQLTARGATEAAFVRTQVFHAADVRRVGRPDLIIAMPTNSSGVNPVTIRYNVPGFVIVPF